MARTVTLASLRTSVQRRGSLENSSDITSAMLTEFINEAVAETYDILVEKWSDYFLSSTTLSFAAGATTASLPADFYKLRALFIADASVPSGLRRLRTHDLTSAHMFYTVVAKNYRYRLQAGNLVIVPAAVSAETLTLYYVPCCPVLAADLDTFDGVNGYEELVVQLAYKRCLQRQELPTGDVDNEVARLVARVARAADGRDAEPFYLDEAGPRRDGAWLWGDG
jgi:hypothetical protein